MASRSNRRTRASRPDDTFWQRLSPTARHGLSLALLLVVAIGFFAPVHFQGQSIQGNDVVNWRANAEAMIEYTDSTGTQALWAPTVFSGMPGYLVNYKKSVPQADTLVNQLRGIAWPSGHLFLLFAGVYLLVVYLTENSLAGLLSAVGFGLTTYIPIIISVGHETKFVALAYAPWVVLAFVYTLRNPSLLGSLLFAAVLAVELRAEHPQITYYVMMVIGLWWVVEVVRAVREEDYAPIAKATGWLALGTVGALLLVAQPYLATYEYKAYSVRGGEPVAGADAGSGNMGWENAMRWSQGPAELVTLAVADAFGGGSSSRPTYWGPKPFTEGPHYVGGIILALALLALWRVRRTAVYGLGVAALFTTLFALGRHAGWVNWPFFQFFPFFDAFRAPETWLSITVLVLAVLGGIGLDYALRRAPKEADDWERSKAVYYSFGAVLALVGALFLFRGAFFDFEGPNERQQLAQRMAQRVQQQRPDLSVESPQVQRAIDQRVDQMMQQQRTQRKDTFAGDAQRTMLLLALALGALALYRQRRVPAWAAGLVVALLVTVDLWSVGKRYLGQEEMSSSQNLVQAVASSQQPDQRVNQFIRDQVEAAGGLGRFRAYPMALNPTNRSVPSYYYEQIGGYHGAKLQRYQDYLDHILQVGSPGPPNDNALDMMSTRYVVAQQQLPGMRQAFRDPQNGLRVLENPDHCPRAYFVGQTEVIASREETWQRLRSGSFAPCETAILPEPLEKTVTPIDSASTARVELQTFTPRTIQWRVETDAPRLLVASEIYYPAGWTATIDGEPAPIRRANYLLRAVHVPAGTHTITMRFDPATHEIGTWVAAVSTALVYGGIATIMGMPYVRRRFLHAAADEEAGDADGDDPDATQDDDPSDTNA
jgi:hypothetical protein